MNGRDLFPKVIPQLDGVRGMAILLVMVCHAEHYGLLPLGGWGKKGWIGVDLFFVLSGFLITGILADAKNKPHFFRNFYGRRMLRILPVYAVVIAATYALLRGGALDENVRAYSWAAYVLLVQNVALTGAGFHALGATWSLAIEEHFYLVWPWLVRRLNSTSLMHVLMLLVVMSPLARWSGWYTGFSRFLLYKHTLLHLDGLAMGGILALWLRAPSFTLQRLRALSLTALALGVPLSLWLVPEDAIEIRPSVFAMSAIAVMCSGFLGLALLASREAQGGLMKVLAFRPLRYAGQVSYCLYLVHIPILDLVTKPSLQQWLESVTGMKGNWPTLAIFALACAAIASLSWYGLEQPILRWKRYLADEEIPAPMHAAAASV